MAFKVAARRVFGSGGYQVVVPTSAAVPAAPFSPSDLSGLIGWWKADSLALANGAAVAAWADSSTGAHDLAQAVGGSQPTYNTAQQNGLPAVTFDGTADFMATAAYASPTAGASVFAVVKLVDVNAYRHLLNHAAAATWISPFSRVLVRVADTAGAKQGQLIVQDAAVVANTLSTTTAPTFVWRYHSFIYDQTNLLIFTQGAANGTKARTGTLTSSTQPVFLGAATDGSTPWNGQVGEVIYYNRGVNSTERGQVEAYLAAKWGL